MKCSAYSKGACLNIKPAFTSNNCLEQDAAHKGASRPSS